MLALNAETRSSNMPRLSFFESVVLCRFFNVILPREQHYLDKPKIGLKILLCQSMYVTKFVFNTCIIKTKLIK